MGKKIKHEMGGWGKRIIGHRTLYIPIDDILLYNNNTVKALFISTPGSHTKVPYKGYTEERELCTK